LKRSSLESAPLAVAFGAAAGAFVSAFVGLRLPMALGIGSGASLLAWIGQRRPLPIRRLPPMPSIVRILLLVIGLLAVLSRDVPVIAEDVANRVALPAGGALLACALALLWAGSAWPVPAALLPAIVGVVVAAGLQGASGQTFVPLACVCGAALWAWALVSGGPRRRFLSLAFFFLAVAGVAVGTVFFLPWAQPYVEAFAARGLGEGQTGLSDRAQLGDIQRLAKSRRVVARVWTTEPQLLRMQVLTNFDNKTGAWSVEPAKPRELLPSDASGASLGPLLSAAPGGLFSIAPEAHGAVVETRVVPSLSFDDGWGLLAPAHPSALRLPVEKVRVDDDQGRIDVEGAVSTYAVANVRTSRETSASLPNGTALWTSPAPRIRALANEVGAKATSPREKVSATLEYLTTHYRYTLEGLPSSLDDFLFEKKAGYCEFFATAAVMLLRHQGIPARFVKGVRVNPDSAVGGHYLVREADAHAWIEAYLPGEGWVEADPTPASGGSGAGRLEGLAARWEGFQSALIEAWIRVREGWPGVRAGLESSAERLRVAVERHPVRSVSAAVGVVVALVAWALRKRIRRATRPTVRKRQDRAPVPAELRDLVRSVERRWARAGRPRPPNRGLQEHLDGLPLGTLATEERNVAARIVATYYRTRYGGAPLGEAELSELRECASALLR
jgi:transglutaminase-like putative cysteine protease